MVQTNSKYIRYINPFYHTQVEMYNRIFNGSTGKNARVTAVFTSRGKYLPRDGIQALDSSVSRKAVGRYTGNPSCDSMDDFHVGYHTIDEIYRNHCECPSHVCDISLFSREQNILDNHRSIKQTN